MFTEGSVLSFTTGIQPRGDVVQVLNKENHPALQHDIFRNAQAFAVPVILMEGENV